MASQSFLVALNRRGDDERRASNVRAVHHRPCGAKAAPGAPRPHRHRPVDRFVKAATRPPRERSVFLGDRRLRRVAEGVRAAALSATLSRRGSSGHSSRAPSFGPLSKAGFWCGGTPPPSEGDGVRALRGRGNYEHRH